MSESNKPIVKKSQEILKSFGYDVKTSHLYEMFAKLSGFESWNVAKVKHANFEHLITKENTGTEEGGLRNHLYTLVKDIENNDALKVVTALHESQGHKVEVFDSLLDQFGISHIITWNGNIRVAVLVRCRSMSKKITGKHLRNLMRAMEVNDCTHGIIYTSMNDLPNSLYKIASDLRIEVVDHEDMMKMAYKVDRLGIQSDLNPETLASDFKESGNYARARKDKSPEEMLLEMNRLYEEYQKKINQK